ncbi:Vacuolar protein sorting-associated protein 13a [Nosema bombycis CQ1]|uniref:Vacuolar protein sorting-associated protein 13a n=1 Tax=Nosema bombycis (strain CQ1 / CVCC 102059) TaxID=578461 RepID=R0M6J6_NOSB1|nr:Vacuolar protein sorting-associated protein 13a [Nosema bombycis CQ1]|eukprot:EOB13634.1 Vacuolar protein sorting-associated protein 13a [Nosema bombycis CQ1]
MLNITSFSLDKNIYTVKHCFIDHKLIASLDPYCKIVQSCQISCKTNKDDKVTFIIKDCNILVDFYEILMSNCLLEIYIHESLFRTKLSVDSLLLDDFLKAESVKIGYENNKIYSESVSIFLNLEELNLKRAYRSYLKYCVGEGSLDVDFMGHLSNLKIVYGPKTKLIDVENLIIDYNSLNNSGKTPLLSIETDSKCIFEVFNYKNNTICCLSELFFDLKVLKKFNNDFLLPRENDINYIIKHFKSVKKAHECKPKVYLYNINLGYEELRLNIEFFEFNSIINTIFTVFLDDGNHIIVDSAKVKLVVGDILQFQITNNVRINITNSILKKINRFFVDIKNIIILSIKEDEDSNSSISWILDIDSISFNVFDMNLNEILAIYILKTKICNVKEHGGDETVRKLYLKINDIQIDNQVIKNTYPVLLYKTKSNDIIEGNLLYYYNNSTLFIKKTDLKFEEMRLNIEGKHLENILEVYKVENVESTSLKTNVESFMNTCVTVKDFHISDLSVKINYLMKSGDNLKDKMLFFVMNNISDFNLSIDKLNISHYRTDMNGLFDIVYGFYKNEIYNNLFKVFGHIDLLGNVGTLTNTISGTIKENVKKKTGFFKGSKILLKNTFLGVTNTLGKISTSVKNNASLLTFDKEFADTSEFHPYAYDVHLPLPFKQNENNLNLIMKGTEKLISSVYSGVLGVAKKPYDGSASGVGGVIVGLGKGVIGAISKPVVGASELFSNCVQCMGGGPVVIRRMMYPMYTVDKIDKYDIDQASSFYIFVTFLNKLEGEEFIDGSFGHFRGECLLILTNLRLIVSTEISIFEFDPFEIDIDTREMNKFIICKEEVTVNKKRFIKNLCEFLM